MSLSNENKTRECPERSCVFSRELFQIRKRLGMSQEELAQSVNISQSYMSALERGTVLPGRKALDKIKALPELNLEDGHRLAYAVQEDRKERKNIH